MPYSLQQHVAYHAWATQRMIDTLQSVDEKIIFQEQKSSFGSIAKTLLHLWDAETIWLKRFSGVSLSDWPSKKFSGGKKELLEGILNSANEVKHFVDHVGEEKLKSKFAYKNLKGEPFEDVVEDIVYHVVNHGTYHRGQIVTLLREAGVTQIQSMDIIIYLRTLRNR